MKRFISGFVAGALIFGMLGAFAAATYVAEPANYKIFVDGKEFASEPPAMVIEGSTYLPLRTIGNALGVEVGWNPELRQAEIMSSEYIEKIGICNYIISDVWNNGFWFLARYADGTSGNFLDEYYEVYGDNGSVQIDIGKVVEHIKGTRGTMDLYNLLFESNKNWQNLYKEYLALYDLAASGRYIDVKIDTSKFESARDNFCISILY